MCPSAGDMLNLRFSLHVSKVERHLIEQNFCQEFLRNLQTLITSATTWAEETLIVSFICMIIIQGADKSLTRPGMKQANVSVRMAWISFGALPCRKRNLMTARVSMLLKSRARPWYTSELVSFLVWLRTYQHPGIMKLHKEFIKFLPPLHVFCRWR